MIASSLPAIRPAAHRLPQSPRPFGVLAYRPVAPGARHAAGDYPAAAGTVVNSRPAAAFLSSISHGRTGRPGLTAAWPGAKFKSRCLRVAPLRDAGQFGRRP